MRRSVALCAVFILRAANAQAPQARSLSATAVGQMLDAVYDTLAKPTTRFSRVALDKRQLVLDTGRTLAAFKRAGLSRAAVADLHLRNHVRAGTPGLLDDCSQLAKLPCAKLGSSVYSTFVPVWIADSVAIVRATFMWPDRSGGPKADTFLVGFTSEVYLRRGKDGVWEFVKIGSTAVG